MKTCLADAPPVAVLAAPVGSTGVCKDGTYASAVLRDRARIGHGGLARWLGQ